jgi:hypothetical protein
MDPSDRGYRTALYDAARYLWEAGTIGQVYDDEALGEVLFRLFEQIYRDFDMTDEQRIEAASRLVPAARDFVFQNLEVIAMHAFMMLVSRALAYSPQLYRKSVGEPYRLVIPTEQELRAIDESLLADWWRYLAERSGAETRDSRGGRKKPKANLGKLAEHYDEIIGDWMEAWAICREALGSRSGTRRIAWRQEVKRSFPEMPNNLVERLQPMADWPADIANICLEKGGEDSPDHIALEHVARICGAGDYAYKLSTLQERYRRQTRQNFKN